MSRGDDRARRRRALARENTPGTAQGRKPGRAPKDRLIAGTTYHAPGKQRKHKPPMSLEERLLADLEREHHDPQASSAILRRLNQMDVHLWAHAKKVFKPLDGDKEEMEEAAMDRAMIAQIVARHLAGMGRRACPQYDENRERRLILRELMEHVQEAEVLEAFYIHFANTSREEFRQRLEEILSGRFDERDAA